MKPLQIILLTHEREVSRPTNTGQIALTCFPQYCQRIVWARTAPDEHLLTLLQQPDTALLFPDESATPTATFEHSDAPLIDNEALSHAQQQHLVEQTMPSTLVILDATWQEARKMLRRSSYLKTARKYTLTTNRSSEFSLRRNQVEGGLCTVECIMALFEQASMHDQAAVLSANFERMLAR
ncbi:tRNA-uridine aminocarboxypropyltransferase [Shewanella youngdeokensis]|uniref:tRNA-uridine aminocarboxypropyltransferase n=1 Tax=Shewanella youngdeokensis TaxID=2999068 RepID=A0ABZ0K2N6_9GAMM|nr:tRNA-uridine aminocarboxypropyltransferase [Shewanella sp. DAU334]